MNKSFQQEIIFVTGKGGVGKSAVAAGIALKRSKQGKKTLLVELGYQSFYTDYFSDQLKSPVGFSPVRLTENLDVALWSGPDCLREYAIYLLKSESIYKLFFENAVSKALINIAPALPELAITGKITSGPRQVGPPLKYDAIVVDAFATGHFLALLKAPQGMAEAIKFGPMGDQSRSIDKVLRDSQQCKYFVVSLPEELPTAESLELAAGIEKILGTQPVIVMNKMLPVENLPNQGSTEFEKFLAKSQERQNQALSLLGSRPIQKISFCFQSETWKIVESISQEINL
ncbi:MAG: ArsA family ATPase [Pseudobdellovibrionaceae bacterium]|jgi:anion-transporting  ArsA/GET3 family ATPase